MISDSRQTVPANRYADPAVVRQLYEEHRHTVRQIAQLLSVSRSQVTAALKEEGVPWRSTRKPCPITVEQLRIMVTNGVGSPAALARKYNVARNTAARWLADAGLISQDPGIDENSLREMYVERHLTTREVAALLGVNHSRILRALAAAGISARPREMKRPRTASASDSGTQAPGGADPLRRSVISSSEAADLYKSGLNIQQVGEKLGVSPTTVRKALHASYTPVRRGREGKFTAAQPDLVSELLTDPDIVALLMSWGITIPQTSQSHDANPVERVSSQTVCVQLVAELYCRIGLSIRQVALLCSMSDATVHRRLTMSGIGLRPATQPSPWTKRRQLIQL
jgi:predicted transcriptional regulator